MSEELKRGIPKAIITGKVCYSDAEKEQHDKDFEKLLKEYGVLKENESLKDMNKPTFDNQNNESRMR